MSSLLAIDTATDALSIALQCDGQLYLCHDIAPRRHQQDLFARLEALLDGRALAELGLAAVVFGRGPGSFTGLRIAASFAQGLAFSLRIPTVALSTLETQARTLLRRQELPRRCLLLSTLDARMGDVYAAFFRREDDLLTPLGDARVGAAASLAPPPDAAGLPLFALGSGCAALDDTGLPARALFPAIHPEAQDMLAPARMALAAGDTVPAASVSPEYLQGRGAWKTQAQQERGA